MLVVIRSAPDTPEGKRGVKIARDMTADIVLMQNGVYFLKEREIEVLGFVRTAYVIEDDRKLRGLKDAAGKTNTKDIDYGGLVDLMTEADKVVGMF